MQCPYCLSEVSKDAFVCKACARDIYMFKELLVKIDELEAVIKKALCRLVWKLTSQAPMS